MIIMPAYNRTAGEIGISLATDRIEVFQANPNICCYYSRIGSYGDGWHHYVITINNSNAPTLYVDGAKVTGNATAFHDSSLFVATALSVGGRKTDVYSGLTYTVSHAYKGYIDDFMIYNRVLSESEIVNLYNRED